MNKYLLAATCIFVLTACDRSTGDKQSRIDTTKPAKVQIMQNGQIRPVTLKPIDGLLQHTDLVGTSDQPTMDGGIINAADGLPVMAFVDINKKSSENLLAKKTSALYQQKSPVKIASESSKSFQDDWATSLHVKALLRQAAQDGKLEYVLNRSDEKGLPASVATVPIIESHYQNKAISPKGAAGAWQLMPVTAKDYGVKEEDRYKFQPSTEAALNLLNDLHKQFGNWELSFAAYNAGADRVQNALRKNPSAKSVQELDLPNETKSYVLRIMALNKTLESL